MRSVHLPSVRVLAAATLPAGALIVAAVAGSLIGTARTLRASVHQLAREARREEHLGAMESSLLRHHRLATQHLVRGDPAIATRRDAALADVQRELGAAAAASSTRSGTRELEAIRRDIADYVERRRRLEEAGHPIRVVERGTRPQLERILERIVRLRARFRERLTASEAEASRLATNAAVGGSVVLAVVMLGLLAFGVGLSRWVVAPLGALLSAIDRFRESGRPVHLAEHGPEEIRRLSCALNETTTALAEQKTRQLAFVAGVAHDLRNPISGLRMATMLARATAPALLASGEGARLLTSVERQTERLARMIDDVVDAMRIEAGELALDPSEHDLREPVRSVVEICAHESPDHEVRLSVPDAPVIVHADPLRMEQVAGNLVTNALKYSPPGTTVDVELRVVDRHAQLSVSDRGIGIAPEEIPHIFEPFRRGTTAAHGAGLGLSVVHRIVAAHGGSIEVVSDHGRGSTFRVMLPLQRAAADDPSRHAEPPRSPPGAP